MVHLILRECFIGSRPASYMVNIVLGAMVITAAGARPMPAAKFIGLGDLPGNSFHSIARGISANGSVVVGDSHSASGYEAFRWTSASGLIGLGDLPGSLFNSVATDVSDDGSTVVGTGVSAAGNEAFRWTNATGMIGLGDLPGGLFFDSRANGVSADGSVIVGRSDSTAPKLGTTHGGPISAALPGAHPLQILPFRNRTR